MDKTELTRILTRPTGSPTITAGTRGAANRRAVNSTELRRTLITVQFLGNYTTNAIMARTPSSQEDRAKLQHVAQNTEWLWLNHEHTSLNK